MPMGVLLVVGGGLLMLGAVAILLRGGDDGSPADASKIEVNGSPSLRLDQTFIDYGEVKLDTPKQFTLTLTNVGGQALTISEPPYLEVLEGC
jgi:hypothetical protein